jgi:signal transduction histidine kinase/ActR/RegA family two-component response regulator
MQTLEPYLTNEPAHDPTVLPEPLQALGFRSLLNTPILDREGRLLGDFELHDKAEGFGPEDVELMRSLSAGAAVAIENAKLVQALRESQESMHEADRRKDEFLALLGHELRNPIAAMRAALYLARRQEMPTVLGRSCAVVERQVSHMTQLVDDLLDVSRIRYGKIRLREEPLDLVEVVRQALFDRQTELAEHGLTLRSHLPNQPVPVSGDPTRLAQVLENLLGNAAKFTDPGGSIDVLVVEEPGERTSVTILDTGLGMDSVTLGRLFQPFAQADRSLAHSRGGLGLGLPLVKGLVELHGGSIDASSPGPGRGSVFRVELPRGRGAEPVLRLQAGLPAGRPRRVLVIEDNADVAESLRLLLEADGHTVATAAGGREGLRKAHEQAPEVVLCDIGLPDIDGYAVARGLRADPATHSSLLAAVTGYGGEEAQRRSLDAGFDVHLTKPLDQRGLLRLLAGEAPRAHGAPASRGPFS